jgi:hypothetical protein
LGLTERFVIATVSGYRSLEPAGGSARPGLSAHVLDRPYNYALVASFRSEDTMVTKGARGRFTGGVPLGREGALERARTLARELNEQNP